MNTQKAISNLETDSVFQSLTNEELLSLSHLIDIAKRFDGAVEVEIDGEEGLQYIARKDNGHTMNCEYNLYAIPKGIE
jgi:hypothetical protein